MIVVRLLEKVVSAAGQIAAYLILVLMVCMVFEVFSRYALGAPTIWAYDLGYMLTGAIFILGLGFTLKERAHIREEIFYAHFTERTRRMIDIFGFGLIAIPVVGLLCFGLHGYFVEAFSSGETAGQSAWNPILWPFRLIMLGGFLLLLLQLCLEVIGLLFKAK
ncbi:MAG: C4-dicarboxylate ABC transporter substrate-binding protein [Proteobacteria bacterium]|nr:MAG: C4-dicarboxylate ABC transporter substrate-binding protein [Pseudomonadota bacterium]